MRDPVLRLVPLQAPQPARDHPGKPGPGVKPAAAGLKKVCWGLDKPRQPRGGWKGPAGASPDVCWGGVEWARVGLESPDVNSMDSESGPRNLG